MFPSLVYTYINSDWIKTHFSHLIQTTYSLNCLAPAMSEISLSSWGRYPLFSSVQSPQVGYYEETLLLTVWRDRERGGTTVGREVEVRGGPRYDRDRRNPRQFVHLRNLSLDVPVSSIVPRTWSVFPHTSGQCTRVSSSAVQSFRLFFRGG